MDSSACLPPTRFNECRQASIEVLKAGFVRHLALPLEGHQRTASSRSLAGARRFASQIGHRTGDGEPDSAPPACGHSRAVIRDLPANSPAAQGTPLCETRTPRSPARPSPPARAATGCERPARRCGGISPARTLDAPPASSHKGSLHDDARSTRGRVDLSTTSAILAS